MARSRPLIAPTLACFIRVRSDAPAPAFLNTMDVTPGADQILLVIAKKCRAGKDETGHCYVIVGALSIPNTDMNGLSNLVIGI